LTDRSHFYQKLDERFAKSATWMIGMVADPMPLSQWASLTSTTVVSATGLRGGDGFVQ